MSTPQVLRAIVLEISRLPFPVIRAAHDLYAGGDVTNKTDAVATLASMVAAESISIDNIKCAAQTAGRVSTSSLDPNALSVASAAARAEAATLDLGVRVDSVQASLDTANKTMRDNEVWLGNVENQLKDLSREIKGIADASIVDPAKINRAVKDAVASAFKPIKEAAESNGTVEEVVRAAGQPTIVGRGTCFSVFGIDVFDAFGNPVEVNLWDSPDAPPIDPNFIWSADILKPLVLGQTGLNLWFGGEKGTGKTQTAMQFAARTGRSFTRYNFRKFTTSEDFLGATGLDGGSSMFKPGPVLQAYTTPGAVILLDEVTSTDPGELIQLNGLLEEGVPRVNIGGTTWAKGQDVMVIAADNTLGSGDSTGRYAGTRMMNSALLDRFALVVPFKFLPPDEEEKALVNITKCRPELARQVVSILTVCRTKAAAGDLVDAPSIRSAINFIRAIPVMGVRDAWNASIAARQPNESAVAIEAIFQSFADEYTLLNLSK